MWTCVYQLLGVGTCVCSLLSVLGPHLLQTQAGPVHTACLSLQVHMCASPSVSKGLVSLVPSSGSSILSTSSSTEFPKPRVEGLAGDIFLGVQCSNISHSRENFISPSSCQINQLLYPIFVSILNDFMLSSNIKYQVEKGEGERGVERERKRKKRDLEEIKPIKIKAKAWMKEWRHLITKLISPSVGEEMNCLLCGSETAKCQRWPERNHLELKSADFGYPGACFTLLPKPILNCVSGKKATRKSVSEKQPGEAVSFSQVP